MLFTMYLSVLQCTHGRVLATAMDQKSMLSEFTAVQRNTPLPTAEDHLAAFLTDPTQVSEVQF